MEKGTATVLTATLLTSYLPPTPSVLNRQRMTKHKPASKNGAKVPANWKTMKRKMLTSQASAAL